MVVAKQLVVLAFFNLIFMCVLVVRLGRFFIIKKLKVCRKRKKNCNFAR